MGEALSAAWAWFWPGWSQVWPNVLASVIWAAPAAIWQHRRMLRKSRADLAQQTEHLFAALADQTDELHARLFGPEGRHAKGTDQP